MIHKLLLCLIKNLVRFLLIPAINNEPVLTAQLMLDKVDSSFIQVYLECLKLYKDKLKHYNYQVFLNTLNTLSK